jgi:uncharacterized membrane protein YtjA (UPF0391 family)
MTFQFFLSLGSYLDTVSFQLLRTPSGVSISSIVFRFSQAFENARVTVLSSAGIIPVCHESTGLFCFCRVWHVNCLIFGLALNHRRSRCLQQSDRGGNRLLWFIAVLIAAFLAVVLGFTHVAIASIGIAKVLFFLFVLLFLVAVLGHVFRRP